MSRYIVRSTINPAMVLCVDGEFHAERMTRAQHCLQPWAIKVYKTKQGAEKAASGYGRKVEEIRIDPCGVWFKQIGEVPFEPPSQCGLPKGHESEHAETVNE